MTVCIVSRCFSSQSIVAVCDARISLAGYTSGDIAIKNQPLIGRWYMMIAGEDISPAALIRRRARSRLFRYAQKLKIDHNLLSFDDVRRAVAEAYEAELEQSRTDAVLGGYGLTMDGFLKMRRRNVKDSLYKELFQKLEQFNFSLDLLVYGFEREALGHIFNVSNPGRITSYDLEGYSATGIGSWIAMNSLMAHNPTILTEPELIYRVCEAKFIAESASDVGRGTYASILDSTGIERILNSKQLDRVRKIWEAKGKPKIPDVALKTIKEELKQAKHR
jgi:20S proteasome alpha/beta subunit